MSTARLVGGIIAALVALFAGGCGLFFFIAGMIDEMAGRVTYGVPYIAVIIGVVPGAIAGWIAWWALKKRPEDASEDGEA